MRKVRYEVAASLDMFMADENGGLDWLIFSKEAGAKGAALMNSVDTLLMGRKTFEFAMKHGGGGDDPGGFSTYVFSTTLQAVPKGAEIVRENAGGFVRDLKTRKGKDIWLMGGGALAGALLEAGAVDQIALNIHPVLLGCGAPVFGAFGPGRAALKLASCEPLAKGCVYAVYDVNG